MEAWLDFRPPFWARGAHFQTMLGTLTRSYKNPKEEETWTFDIDDKVSLRGRFLEGRTKKLAILYHGLGGSFDSAYVMGAAFALRSIGFSTLRMSLRGAETEPPYTPATYHSGLTEDIDIVMNEVQKRGFSEIYLLGFSLSGNLILKWLGQGRKDIVKAMVVSPPVRLEACATRLEWPSNWIYQKYFMIKLKELFQHKVKLFPEVFQKYDSPQVYRGVRVFDEHVTSKIHGFKDSNDYYQRASSYYDLGKIKNSVRVFHAEDDPMVDSEDLKADLRIAPSNVDLRLYPIGGHVGFYEGPPRGHLVDTWVQSYFGSTV